MFLPMIMILPMSFLFPCPLAPMFPRSLVRKFVDMPLSLLPMFLPCSFPKLISRLSQPLRDGLIRQVDTGGVWGSVLLLLLLGPLQLSPTHFQSSAYHPTLCPSAAFPSPPPLRIFSTPSHLSIALPAAALDDTLVLYIQIHTLFSNYNITSNDCSALIFFSFTLSNAALCRSRQPTSCAMILISHIPTPRITVRPKRLVGHFLLARLRTKTDTLT